jgi:hypothetical protein
MRLRQTLGFLAGGGGGKQSVGGDEELVQTSMFGVFPSTVPDTAGAFFESGRDEAASYERGNFRGRPTQHLAQFTYARATGLRKDIEANIVCSSGVFDG